jgi:hypothetical protein
MEDRETPRIHKYGETKTTRIMMATTSRDCLSGTYEISGRLIFVEQSIPAEAVKFATIVCLVCKFKLRQYPNYNIKHFSPLGLKREIVHTQGGGGEKEF